MCRTSGPQGWSGAHTHMGVSWLCMGKCVGVSGHASASPTHLFLIHILPHDAGEEAVLHDLLGILRATSKPAEDTGRGDRAITCLPRVGTSCQAPPTPHWVQPAARQLWTVWSCSGAGTAQWACVRDSRNA